jgi:hypothetical protein
MIQPLRKRQFRLLIAALLVFAVFGSLVFSKAEPPPRNSEMSGRRPYSKGAFSPFGHIIYWLAEKTSTESKAKKNSSAAMWKGAPGVIMSGGIQGAAECLIILSIYITSRICFSKINNAVPLKLRI